MFYSYDLCTYAWVLLRYPHVYILVVLNTKTYTCTVALPHLDHYFNNYPYLHFHFDLFHNCKRADNYAFVEL